MCVARLLDIMMLVGAGYLISIVIAAALAGGWSALAAADEIWIAQ